MVVRSALVDVRPVPVGRSSACRADAHARTRQAATWEMLGGAVGVADRARVDDPVCCCSSSVVPPPVRLSAHSAPVAHQVRRAASVPTAAHGKETWTPLLPARAREEPCRRGGAYPNHRAAPLPVAAPDDGSRTARRQQEQLFDDITREHPSKLPDRNVLPVSPENESRARQPPRRDLTVQTLALRIDATGSADLRPRVTRYELHGSPGTKVSEGPPEGRLATPRHDRDSHPRADPGQQAALRDPDLSPTSSRGEHLRRPAADGEPVSGARQGISGTRRTISRACRTRMRHDRLRASGASTPCHVDPPGRADECG